MLHVWNIYRHLVHKWPKCRYIWYTTWSIWDINPISLSIVVSYICIGGLSVPQKQLPMLLFSPHFCWSNPIFVGEILIFLFWIKSQCLLLKTSWIPMFHDLFMIRIHIFDTEITVNRYFLRRRRHSACVRELSRFSACAETRRFAMPASRHLQNPGETVEI